MGTSQHNYTHIEHQRFVELIFVKVVLFIDIVFGYS